MLPWPSGGHIFDIVGLLLVNFVPWCPGANFTKAMIVAIAMMESSMKLPIVKQCITAEDLKDMGKQIRESLKGETSCQFKVLSSNSKELKGEFNCSGSVTLMHTKVINSKRHEADITTTSAEMGVNKLRSVSEWKSDVFPSVA